MVWTTENSEFTLGSFDILEDRPSKILSECVLVGLWPNIIYCGAVSNLAAATSGNSGFLGDEPHKNTSVDSLTTHCPLIIKCVCLVNATHIKPSTVTLRSRPTVVYFADNNEKIQTLHVFHDQLLRSYIYYCEA